MSLLCGSDLMNEMITGAKEVGKQTNIEGA